MSYARFAPIAGILICAGSFAAAEPTMPPQAAATQLAQIPSSTVRMKGAGTSKETTLEKTKKAKPGKAAKRFCSQGQQWNEQQKKCIPASPGFSPIPLPTRR